MLGSLCAHLASAARLRRRLRPDQSLLDQSDAIVDSRGKLVHLATDDEAAKDAVCGLSGSIGFRPVHVGPLAAARELEAMAWLNIRMQMRTGGQWNTAFVMVDPPEAALTYGR